MTIIGPKAYIHLDRLKQNLWNIRKQIGDRHLLCVVKADGYGHGATVIARAIAREPGVSFAVFVFEEALELRQAGITNEILIFSRLQKSWLEDAARLNLVVSASAMGDLELLQDVQGRIGKCPRFHVKFDTGMTRLGFDLADSDSVFGFLNANKSLPAAGIYSHFATADEGDLSYAHTQLHAFQQVVKEGQEAGLSFQYIHCSNSGAVLNLSGAYFNMVRVGMLLYGAAPSHEVTMDVDVEPVMSFCGPIVNIRRRVQAGTQVSYGGVYTTVKETNIAVVQTGFADGFPRPWYERGFVSYKGLEYKIAGRACMDQFMVDFGDVEPEEGEEVLIFGKRGLDQLPVERIAQETGTTTYVLLTGIHGRTEHITLP
ncbi:MAG: alanine racemase [Candidatus Neomarinimicrobiota bacterium]|nr:alanine racemase [Candidatus Neomarinimicrobiota bacterium]